MDLADRLRKRVSGDVRFDGASRALYATDASNYRQTPIGVVIPQNIDDIISTVDTCREFGAPVLTRGGGTSLAGQCCNRAVVLDTTRHVNRLLEIDPERRFARVEPGIVLDTLRAAAETHGLTFGPDPATHSRCTLGGMIGNNSCGVHSVMAGRTVDNVDELDILTYGGCRMTAGATDARKLAQAARRGGRESEIYSKLESLAVRHAGVVRERFPNIPRRVSGYNLPQLLPENGFHVARSLVGSEGTCVAVLSAKLRLVENPPCRAILLITYKDIYAAAADVPRVLEQVKPIGLEGLDDRLVGYVKKKRLSRAVELFGEGGGWLVAEIGARSSDELKQKLKDSSGRLNGGPQDRFNVFEDAQDQCRIWHVRESGLGATAFVPGEPDTWPGWEDSAVHPAKLPEYLKELRALMDRFGYDGAFYGHFGDGCLHTRISFRMNAAEGVRRYREFISLASDIVVRHGGSLSGEHGDGQARAEFLEKMYGAEILGAFREFKSIWDPDGKMNPGKIVEPFRADENLRLLGFGPQPVKTHFRFPEDDGDFRRSTVRCVGVGECRRDAGGTMCPSWRATHEEKHTTRGRARLLFEMLQGETIKNGWKDEGVKEALDLCLACKGCKSDCPVNVDMATYKAEFLSHYYRGRFRPRSAYAFGFIDRWARLGSLAPRLANFFSENAAFKELAGISPQRTPPQFADRTFRSRWKRRAVASAKDRVVLWPDTFNDNFYPETLESAALVLESMGFEVVLPRGRACCGRPLYDFGFLDQAKAYLRKVLRVLGPEIRAGTPVVGLEPSCVAVFRDELGDLFAGDETAERLKKQAFFFPEFIEREMQRARFKPLGLKAVVHGHCHYKALGAGHDLDADRRVLESAGVDVRVPITGCCGMAGAFGFEKEHYGVSLKVAEDALLPALRDESGRIIVADGFSCREQIAALTGRAVNHSAQILSRAIR